VKQAKPRFAGAFKVIVGNRRSQAAEMVLRDGDKEGDSANRHRGADQWLYVAAGRGTAIVNGRRHPLTTGTLLLIERGDRHEIRQARRSTLRTLNIYVPPAYTKGGEPLPRGRR
jgi:mannose-6-phosphate isomerase-like protein (cupin superfamily)